PRPQRRGERGDGHRHPVRAGLGMPRRWVAGADHRPRWSRDGVPVEGPDEDAFTLAVAAAEAIRRIGPARAAPTDRLAPVGGFADGMESRFADALDLDAPEIHRHGVGAEALVHAVHDVVREPAHDEGAGLVLLVDVAGPPGEGKSAAAAAVA